MILLNAYSKLSEQNFLNQLHRRSPIISLSHLSPKVIILLTSNTINQFCLFLNFIYLESQCVLFCDWLFLPNIMFLRPIRVPGTTIAHLFSLLYGIPLYKYTTIWLSSLLVLNIWMDSSLGLYGYCSVNTLTCVFRRTYVIISVGYIPKSKIVRSCGTSMIKFSCSERKKKSINQSG